MTDISWNLEALTRDAQRATAVSEQGATTPIELSAPLPVAQESTGGGCGGSSVSIPDARPLVRPLVGEPVADLRPAFSPDAVTASRDIFIPGIGNIDQRLISDNWSYRNERPCSSARAVPHTRCCRVPGSAQKCGGWSAKSVTPASSISSPLASTARSMWASPGRRPWM